MRQPDQALYRCTGTLICPEQIIERLNHFVARDAFNIVGFGTKTIAALVHEKRIRIPGDLFRLEQYDQDHPIPLKDRHGWNLKSVQNLFQAIETSRTITLDRFIFALGILQIGKRTAQILARTYGSWTTMYQTMIEAQDRSSTAYQELLNINQIGPSMAESLVLFFAEPHNQEILTDLCQQIQIQDDSRQPNISSPLNRKTIVFTGTLTSMTRDEAKVHAERLGAHISGSLSHKTDMIIVGDNSGSNKLAKAYNLGVSIINEQEWLKIISS